MTRSHYRRRIRGHPDRTRCIPDERLRRLFDERPPELRKVAVVRYDPEFARFQSWWLDHSGTVWDRLRRVVDPLMESKRKH